jgi:DNA repair protein RadD
MKPLRPHQAEALRLLRESIGKGNSRPLVQAPTGAGKTVIASHIVAGARAKGKRACFVVPAVSLIDQTVQSFYRDGIHDIGVIQADHPLTDYSKPVQVASIQTLARRNLDRHHFDVVIVDEAHQLYKSQIEWMQAWNKIPFIGLSATPWTRGLGKFYDDLIVAATTQELIDACYLAPFRVFAPSHPDLSGVKVVAGDYHEGQLSAVMQEGTLVADVVSTWIARGEGRPTLAFCVDRAHAKSVQQQFLSHGVRCGYVDAYTDRDERAVIARQFQSGELQVIANVGVLTTGVDWDVRCIILARPTRSEILFTQIIGRGLRTADGKQDCLILDHSDTHLKLGFVTDIQHESLCDGTKRETVQRDKEALPKECAKCHYLKPPKVHECPACGFKPQALSKVETVAGHLAELEQNLATKERTQRKANRDTSPSDKAAFFGGLKHYAAERGYKSGWAANQYREKYGVWPNAFKDAKAVRPNADVLGWIKHQKIKFAHRRASA